MRINEIKLKEREQNKAKMWENTSRFQQRKTFLQSSASGQSPFSYFSSNFVSLVYETSRFNLTLERSLRNRKHFFAHRFWLRSDSVKFIASIHKKHLAFRLRFLVSHHRIRMSGALTSLLFLYRNIMVRSRKQSVVINIYAIKFYSTSFRWMAFAFFCFTRLCFGVFVDVLLLVCFVYIFLRLRFAIVAIWFVSPSSFSSFTRFGFMWPAFMCICHISPTWSIKYWFWSTFSSFLSPFAYFPSHSLSCDFLLYFLFFRFVFISLFSAHFALVVCHVWMYFCHAFILNLGKVIIEWIFMSIRPTDGRQWISNRWCSTNADDNEFHTIECVVRLLYRARNFPSSSSFHFLGLFWFLKNESSWPQTNTCRNDNVRKVARHSFLLRHVFCISFALVLLVSSSHSTSFMLYLRNR